VARPPCTRLVSIRPPSALFKPAGVPARDLEELVLTLDELEALRLADLEGLYQEDAAAQMGISRPTLGRVLEQARRKVAEALVLGRALRITGGPVAPRPQGPGCSCPRRGPAARDCPRCGAGGRSPTAPAGKEGPT
jgi:predicted DNA-binding protein (UPF0251 family)